MRKFPNTFTPLTGGFICLVLILAAEFVTRVSGSVAYVLVVLVVLKFSWQHPRMAWLGVFATLMIAVGFFIVDNPMDPAVAINRLLSIATIWLGVMFAIRYRKLSDAEAVQKRQLQALFENATEGMIFTNARGVIVRINPAAERMFGYDPGALLGEKIEILVPENYAQAHVGERNRLVQNPRSKPKGTGRELPARRKNGSEFFAEISLNYFYEYDQVFYIAFVVDISERKRHEQVIEMNVNSIKRLNAALDAKVKLRTAELVSANLQLQREVAERKSIAERLEKSQQLHNAIARNFPDGMIGVLNREKRFVLADGRELDFIQKDPIGQRLFEGQDSLGADAALMIEKALLGDHVTFDLELKKRVYNITAVPLPDKEKTVNEVLVVMKNITALKTAEQKLIRTVEKEKQLSALKSRFVTMASHEFRTPLSTMLSSVFLLQNYSGDKYEAQKKTHLDRITRSIQTLTELMNDFLSIGRLEEGHVKAVYSPVEVHGYLKETMAELNAIRKNGQEIHLEFTGEETTIMTDRQMLTNILRNLISNAVKYSAEGQVINVRALVADEQLVIHVEDKGMGIPEAEQREIFKRFYRAENATNVQGTGLGLNIVRKYVNILQGEISFQSKLNEGTTFTLTVPAKDVAQIHTQIKTL